MLNRKMTTEQCRDTGMAVVLLVLLVCVFRQRQGLLLTAVALLVVNMTVPALYRPAAVVWLGLSEVLGAVTSKLLLSLVYFLVVTPMGMVRRLAGKDSLKLRAFKASEESVMLERNHMFAGGDIERPY